MSVRQNVMIVAAMAMGVLSAVVAAADPKGDWLTDYSAAVAQAKKEKKIVLMDFTGSDWCVRCMQLHKEVFNTKEFKEWAAKNAVLLKVDNPKDKTKQSEAEQKQTRDLLRKYQVRSFPSVLFVDPSGKETEELGRLLGYSGGGVKLWLPEAKKIVARSKK